MLTKRKIAFTLAEVLITLGIIGIVASLTIPTLMQKHNNKVVETRLKKFYSTINQAVRLSEADNGDKIYWYQDINNIDYDNEGNPINGSSIVEKWWKKYMAPYIKTVDIKYDSVGRPIFIFVDGSSLKAEQINNMRDWRYYVGNPDKCISKDQYGGIGKCSFYFIFMPGGYGAIDSSEETWGYHINKGFEPYKFDWHGNRDELFNGTYGCRENNMYAYYCTALIQLNDWKIPDDYPFKVNY